MAFPLPPPEIAGKATNTTGQAILTIAIAVGVVVVYGVAVRLHLKYRTWVPIAVALGSTFCALIEPLPDVVANLWYYAPGQHTIYTSLQNPFPIWTFFSYTVFYGGFGLLFWWLVERGTSRRRLLLACAAMAVYLAGAELFMINVMDVYTYYGPSAFEVAHFPVWICVLNTSIILAIGTGTARIRRSLPGRDQLVPAFFLPAISMVLGLLFVPLVLWTVIHSGDPSQGLVYLATLVAIGMAAAMMYTAMRLMPAEGFAPIEPPDLRAVPDTT